MTWINEMKQARLKPDIRQWFVNESDFLCLMSIDCQWPGLSGPVAVGSVTGSRKVIWSCQFFFCKIANF